MTNDESLKNDEARSSNAGQTSLPAERRIFATRSFVIRASLDIPSFVLRHLLSVTVALITFSPAQSCLAVEPPLVRYEFREPHMGTEFKIILYTPDEPSANAASRAAFQRIAQLDAMLSDYRADSELMQLCAKAGGPPVPVSEELFSVLARAQDLAKRCDGSFDVTVGPLVRLWRRARRQHQLPDAERLARARELVGYQLVRLDDKHRTVQLLKPGMQLDLGGIAKGYAADEATGVLKRRGVTRSLVAASGDIVVTSPPPGEPGWTIGVAPLDGADKPPSDYLLLRDAAVSTSGDAEQFVELDGKRYSHIVDPKTGLALTDRVQVTVVAPNGVTADSLATAASVLGPDRGMKLVESSPDVAGLIVRVENDRREVFESSRFKTLARRRSSPTIELVGPRQNVAADAPRNDKFDVFAQPVRGVLSRSGQPTMAQFTWLRVHGWKAVVDLRTDGEYDETADDSKLPGFRDLGFKYLHLPVIDANPPTDRQAMDFLRFVVDRANQPVHVHCRAGVGRTGSMVAVYRYSVEGWPLAKAIEEAGLFPDGLNSSQRKWLESWAAKHEPGTFRPAGQ